MTNHCVYETCEICGEEYCARGCGYKCKCEEKPQEVIKKLFDENGRLKELLIESVCPICGEKGNAPDHCHFEWCKKRFDILKESEAKE